MEEHLDNQDLFREHEEDADFYGLTEFSAMRLLGWLERSAGAGFDYDHIFSEETDGDSVAARWQFVNYLSEMGMLKDLPAEDVDDRETMAAVIIAVGSPGLHSISRKYGKTLNDIFQSS